MGLHVPALRMDEIVRVVRSMEVFELRDIPDAVDALVGSIRERVPIKKLLLWIDMAKQGVEKDARIPLSRWSQVLLDLS